MDPNQFAYKPPKDVRQVSLGEYEIRKLWDDSKAEFYYVLAQKYKIERCELKGEGDDAEPNWDNIIETIEDWGVVPTHRGDEEWAAREADHYNIEVPADEYKED